MTLRTLILRSLRFHWRSHLGVLLGAAIGSAALIGALVVGDSVKGSLREMALRRLGDTDHALIAGDRFFESRLAGEMRASLTNNSSHRGGGEVAAGLLVQGVALSSGGESRANRVNIIGWSPEFGRMVVGENAALPQGDEALISEALAQSLGVSKGDSVTLRMKKLSKWSAESPLVSRSGDSTVLRVRIAAVLPAASGGNFSLIATPAPPMNAFVPLEVLQRAVERTGGANLLLMGDAHFSEHLRIGTVERFIREHGLSALSSRLVASTADGVEPRTLLIHGLSTNGGVSYNADDGVKSLPAEGKDWQPRNESLRLCWRLGDVQLRSTYLSNSAAVQLSTERVFLDEAIARAVHSPPQFLPLLHHGKNGPDISYLKPAVAIYSNWPSLFSSNAQPVLTYLVNLLRAGTNAVPYSMVTGAGAPWTPTDMRDDEILLNQWLADDLRVKAGDHLELVYYQPESGAKLLEATNRFRVRAVVPMAMPWADRTLMPEFPGIEKAESTADWDTAFPLVHKIRPQDEVYWKQQRGTPKAFVTLAAGQKMWANRFGNLTAIRFPVPTNAVGDEVTRLQSQTDQTEPMRQSEPPYVGTYKEALERKILATLRPEEVGLRFEPVRAQALQAAAQSQDFGGLFIGFSFFLIAAALLLVALLFQFGVEQRVTEVGTLLALGFPPKQVRRLWLGEGAALAFVGGVLGAVGGVFYARAMLHGLGTLWRDAVGGTALNFHVSAGTLVVGVFASTAVAVIVIWLTVRNLARRPARELLAGGGNGEARSPKSEVRKARWRWRLPMRWLAAGGAIGLVALTLARGDTANAGAFFGAGVLVLIAGLGFLSAACMTSVAPVSSLPGKENRDRRDACPTVAGLALRGLARRRSRSVATAALLACGSFLIASIGVFRLDADRDAAARSSGTGGFALIGESTLPVFDDLNTTAGRDALGLNAADLQAVNVVSFRVRAGDEASCLNLNRAQQPRLLGVQPEALAGRFTFTKGAGWRELVGQASRLSPSAKTPEKSETGATPVLQEIPAIGDAASIQWALGKKIGDTLDYVDERGQPFKVRLVGAVANSILQGSLVIDEAEFVRRFPSASGHQFFLLDAPTNRIGEVSAALSRGLRDYGLELTPAARRLDQFNAVQNTYLGTFQVLGGLGLLLGSAGLGIVVLRNVLERRSELAVLLALGWRRSGVRRLVALEHAALLAAGLAIGVTAAAVAVLPALLAPGGSLPWRSLAPTLLGVALVGGLAAALATRWALRGNLLAALRND